MRHKILNMKKDVLEFRTVDENTFLIIKNGKPFRSPTLFDTIDIKIKLSHPVFDLPCAALPENKELAFNIAELAQSFPIVRVLRIKNKIIIEYFITIYAESLFQVSLFNQYLLISEMIKIAKTKSFTLTSPMSEENPFTDLRKEYKATGTLREKIVKDCALLDKIKMRVEKKLIGYAKKGKLIIDFVPEADPS
jgi:hypothetical protein